MSTGNPTDAERVIEALWDTGYVRTMKLFGGESVPIVSGLLGEIVNVVIAALSAPES